MFLFFSFQNAKMEPSILPEETAEELAEVISPELKPKQQAGMNPILKPKTSLMIDEAGSSILSQGASGVTLLSIGGEKQQQQEAEAAIAANLIAESFSAKL